MAIKLEPKQHKWNLKILKFEGVGERQSWPHKSTKKMGKSRPLDSMHKENGKKKSLIFQWFFVLSSACRYASPHTWFFTDVSHLNWYIVDISMILPKFCWYSYWSIIDAQYRFGYHRYPIFRRYFSEKKLTFQSLITSMIFLSTYI